MSMNLVLSIYMKFKKLNNSDSPSPPCPLPPPHAHLLPCRALPPAAQHPIAGHALPHPLRVDDAPSEQRCWSSNGRAAPTAALGHKQARENLKRSDEPR